MRYEVMYQKLSVSLEEAVEHLNGLGYQTNAWGVSKPVEIENGEVLAIKTFEKDKVAVVFEIFKGIVGVLIGVYRYKGRPQAHESVARVRNHKKYTDEIASLWEEKA